MQRRRKTDNYHVLAHNDPRQRVGLGARAAVPRFAAAAVELVSVFTQTAEKVCRCLASCGGGGTLTRLRSTP